MKRIVGYLIVAASVALGGVWVAAQVDLTSFQAGTVIRAEEVNANFRALRDALGDVVSSVNGKRGAVVLEAGSNVAIDDSQEGKLVISAGGGGGGGGVASVTAGAGLTGGGSAGDVSLAVDFGGSGSADSAARSDHDHLATHYTKAEADARVAAEIAAEIAAAAPVTHTFSVEAADWGNNLHYGDNNVFRAFDIPAALVGGTDLRAFWNAGGTILVYAQPQRSGGYNEDKAVPHLYSQGTAAGDIGVKIEYIPRRSSLVISQTDHGWDSNSIADAELPARVDVRVVLIGSVPAP